MAGWTVLLRGIRFRAGRSLLVVLLATVVTAAAVIATGYLRAAAQSSLTDALRAAPAYATGIVVTGGGPAAASSAPAIADEYDTVRGVLARRPLLAAAFTHPVAAVDTDTLVSGSGGAGAARLAFREGVCTHVRVDGACPTGSGEVMVSARSAQSDSITVGSHLTITYGGTHPHRVVATVVGLYTPRDPDEAYWGANAYFAAGADPSGAVAQRLDAVFAASESDVRADPDAAVAVHLEMALRPSAVGVDDVATLRADLAGLASAARGEGLTLSTALPDVLDDAAAARRSLDRTVPIVAVPLLLLCLFVLFTVVAALAEERAPEVALAKLRGFPGGRAARFGVGEIVTLIGLAAPVGWLLGLGAVEATAHWLLAPGTHVEAGWPVVVAGIGAPLVGVFAAWLAARSTTRRPVLGLLRRVPQRGGWRAGVAEGVAVTAALAALVTAYTNRSSPLAWLAAPLLALVAGLAAARLLAVLSKLHVGRAIRTGRIVGLLSAARLAREPGRHRVIAVITVAVALLVFGATAWDVGAQARTDRARDSLGADRVYSVLAPYPSALVTAVGQADPTGNSMAVVRASQRFAGTDVDLLGVESQLLAKVATWRGESHAQLVSIAASLHPAAGRDIRVTGTLTVAVDVSRVTAHAVQLGVMLAAPGQPPALRTLGVLARGVHLLRIDAATGGACPSGCRLVGLGLSPVDPGAAAIDADFAVTSIQAVGDPVTDFADADRWVAPAGATVTPGRTLRVVLHSTDLGATIVRYADGPTVLPVVVAGPSPADDPHADTFTFPGLQDDTQAFQVVDRAVRLPRAGSRGLMFDLDDAVHAAERTGTLADTGRLQYEVWADADAPADLAARLAARGITVRATQTLAGYTGRLARGAPALGLWLYLFAGGLALALALGVALLGAYVGADSRAYEYAALEVAGVRPGLLRRALVREYRSTVGLAWLVGAAAGAAGAVLMLPGIALVSVGDPVGNVPYGAHMRAVPAAIVASLVVMAAVIVVALRLLRLATPQRLREGVR